MEARETAIAPGYFATRDGRVLRRKRDGSLCELRPFQNKYGYLCACVRIGRKQRRRFVHRLVASAWLGEIPDGKFVNHKDGDKHNNAVDNLEYVTTAENNHHAADLGLWSAFGEDHGSHILSADDVRRIRSAQPWNVRTIEALAEELGVSTTRVQGIRQRRGWSHIGGSLLGPKVALKQIAAIVLGWRKGLWDAQQAATGVEGILAEYGIHTDPHFVEGSR